MKLKYRRNFDYYLNESHLEAYVVIVLAKDCILPETHKSQSIEQRETKKKQNNRVWIFE